MNVSAPGVYTGSFGRMHLSSTVSVLWAIVRLREGRVLAGVRAGDTFFDSGVDNGCYSVRPLFAAGRLSLVGHSTRPIFRYDWDDLNTFPRYCGCLFVKGVHCVSNDVSAFCENPTVFVDRGFARTIHFRRFFGRDTVNDRACLSGGAVRNGSLFFFK